MAHSADLPGKYGDVGGRIAQFTKKAEQKKAPAVSKSWNMQSYRQKLGNHGEDYGTPVPGSKTDIRGRQAGVRISNEIVDLCRIVHDLGVPQADGSRAILFGMLFDFYTKISNKLVGMLMRARRHGLIEFEGEMLFQRRDDDVVIRLVKIPMALREILDEREQEGGEAEQWDIADI